MAGAGSVADCAESLVPPGLAAQAENLLSEMEEGCWTSVEQTAGGLLFEGATMEFGAGEVAGAEAGLAEAAEGAAEDEQAAVRTYQTYTKVNPETGQVYAGRTSGFGTPLENIAARDASHAYNDFGFGPAELDQTSDSYAAIRGREQQLIEYYQDQGISANKINGISPTNPNGPGYLQTANNAFGPFP